jgi:hypothetical protein
MQQIPLDDAENKVSPVVFNEQMDAIILIALRREHNEYIEAIEQESILEKILRLSMLLIEFSLPYARLVAVASISLITFLNVLKSTNNLSASIDITIVTIVWSCLIFFVLSILSTYGNSKDLHPEFFSRVIMVKTVGASWMVLIEYIVCIIVIICVMVSLETFDDGCVTNVELCNSLWQLWHLIFFHN